VSSREDEEILKVKRLVIDKSVLVDELKPCKAIGGVGMRSYWTGSDHLQDFIAQVREREKGGA
jgi:hypothetical protein